MKNLQVIVCKTSKGVSAHLPEVEGYLIARDTISLLKKDLRKGIQFHIEGLYEEERKEWMTGEYDFEYIFKDIPSLVDAYSGLINQSSLARIAGINEGQMRQYASGVKHPKKRTLEKIESGLKNYAHELQSVSFAYV